MGVVYQGYTTKERHSAVKRALVGFLEDLEMNKFTVPICFFRIKTTAPRLKTFLWHDHFIIEGVRS